MARLTKREIRMKALRAAAGVALFTGTLACGTTDLDPLAPQPITRGADAGLRDAGGAPQDAGFADAGFHDAGIFCDITILTSDDYVACCTAIDWDWDRGCAAWGPPAPPAMIEVA